MVRGRIRAARGASAGGSRSKSRSLGSGTGRRRGMAEGRLIRPIMIPAMEQNLRVPGPTPIPDEVRQAQAQPMIDHRGTEFGGLLREVTDGIRQLVATDGEVFLLTGSGTGALEAALVNTLSPGDRVLAISIGAFGDRFAKIAEAFGADVDKLDVEWGEAADPAAVAERLASEQPYRAVLVTHNETS